jgi:hypothetical protein
LFGNGCAGASPGAIEPSGTVIRSVRQDHIAKQEAQIGESVTVGNSFAEIFDEPTRSMPEPPNGTGPEREGNSVAERLSPLRAEVVDQGERVAGQETSVPFASGIPSLKMESARAAGCMSLDDQVRIWQKERPAPQTRTWQRTV